MALRELKASSNPTFEEVQELLREGETLFVGALTRQFSNARECRPDSEMQFNGFVQNMMLGSFQFYGES